MTRRRLVSALSMAATMAILATAGQDAQSVEIKRSRVADVFDPMDVKAEYKERRKRGGNGKGRKWWNN